jgi:hypothetical protein
VMPTLISITYIMHYIYPDQNIDKQTLQRTRVQQTFSKL